MTCGDVESEGPSKGDPSGPGSLSHDSAQGIPKPSPSGLLDPLGLVRAGGPSGPPLSPSLSQLSAVPICTTQRVTVSRLRQRRSACSVPAWSQVLAQALARTPLCQHGQLPGAVGMVGLPRSVGGRSSLGPPTMTVTTAESTKAAQGGQSPPQGTPLRWHLGPPPRSVQRPRSTTRRRYGWPGWRQKAAPGGWGAGGGKGQGSMAVPTTGELMG